MDINNDLKQAFINCSEEGGLKKQSLDSLLTQLTKNNSNMSYEQKEQVVLDEEEQTLEKIYKEIRRKRKKGF